MRACALYFRVAVDRSFVAPSACAKMAVSFSCPQGRPRMTFQAKLLCAVAVSGLAAFVAAAPAQALTMQECSAQYKAAKDAGTLNGQKWNDCGKSQGAAAAPPAAARGAGAPAQTAKAKPKKEAAPAVATAAVGNAVFPNAIDPKYAKESAGKARMHTCVDQYNANK